MAELKLARGKAPKKETQFMVDPTEDVILVENKKDPLYDPRVTLPVDESLVEAILAGRVTPPTVVRDGDRVKVLDGTRRTKAWRVAKARHDKENSDAPPLLMPVIVRHGLTDLEMYEIKVQANLGQPDAPSHMAWKVSHYLRPVDEGGLGGEMDRAQTIFNRTAPQIKMLLALMDLDRKLTIAVDDGAISITSASAMAKLSKEDQVAELEKIRASGEKPTVREVTSRVAKRRKGESTSATQPENVYKAPPRTIMLSLSAWLAAHENKGAAYKGALDVLHWAITGEEKGIVEMALKAISEEK